MERGIEAPDLRRARKQLIRGVDDLQVLRLVDRSQRNQPTQLLDNVIVEECRRRERPTSSQMRRGAGGVLAPTTRRDAGRDALV